MASDLLLVRFAKADGADLAAAERENETVEYIVDVAERDVPGFTVVETPILTIDRRRHIHFFSRAREMPCPATFLASFSGSKVTLMVSVPPITRSINNFWGYKAIKLGCDH
jgi:hypothetical protein